MLFLFRSAPEVEKRIHSKLFRKFWRSRGTKEPAYITVHWIFEYIMIFNGLASETYDANNIILLCMLFCLLVHPLEEYQCQKHSIFLKNYFISLVFLLKYFTSLLFLLIFHLLARHFEISHLLLERSHMLSEICYVKILFLCLFSHLFHLPHLATGVLKIPRRNLEI